MNDILARWNSLDADAAAQEILPCCGSHAWASALASRRPFPGKATLIEISSQIWLALPEDDWQEAFDSHPRIGQNKPQTHATEESLRWSAQEQSAALPSDTLLAALECANRRYEQRFHRIFIVCATGRSASEILAILEARMDNDTQTELREAAEQQRQITVLRLQRWLESN